MVKINQRMEVYDMITEGPTHCHNVADEMGLSIFQACAILSTLHSLGLITRDSKINISGVKKKCWLYEVK